MDLLFCLIVTHYYVFEEINSELEAYSVKLKASVDIRKLKNLRTRSVFVTYLERGFCFLCFITLYASVYNGFRPTDHVIVWRIRWQIIRTVLCTTIVPNRAHSCEQLSQSLFWVACVYLNRSSLFVSGSVCFVYVLMIQSVWLSLPSAVDRRQWRNILTGGPWTNYIKGPIPHFEFTEEFIIIKVLTFTKKISCSLQSRIDG